MDIIMPKMGESVNEGTIIKWHKKVGDTVKRDEIIFEISTDKVDTEIPPPADGILSAIKVNEGETVEVGTVVAIVNSQPETKQTEPPPAPVQPKTMEPKPVSSVPQPSKIDNSLGENLIDIEMPKMGESVMEGTIIKWYKKTGDRVKKDEPLFEISTDKVDTEIPSPV